MVRKIQTCEVETSGVLVKFWKSLGRLNSSAWFLTTPVMMCRIPLAVTLHGENENMHRYENTNTAKNLHWKLEGNGCDSAYGQEQT